MQTTYIKNLDLLIALTLALTGSFIIAAFIV
jgi:hypothetical protein